MKKTMAFVFAASLALAGTAMAKEATTTMKVTGWHCAGCAGKTESAVKGLPGVSAAHADKKTDTLTVTYDDAKTQPADLEKAVSSAGFKVAK